MGGAIFVVDGGSLTVEGNFTVNGNSVAGGAAGGAGATAGSAYGSGLFLQGSGTLTFTPGAGNTQTISDNIADQTGSGGTGTYATGGPTCTAGVGCGSYSGAGSWALTKAGAGTLVLSGANTYTGGTTIAGGTLRVENNAALGTGTVRTTGSVLDYANGITLNNPIVIDSNTTQLQVLAGSATQAGAISELNGPRPLEKIGAGTLTLATPATYTGTTMVRAGTLQAGGANVFATGSAHNVAGTLTVGGDNTSQGVSGSITGSGGLTKAGTGALILLGASSYSGGTTVSQGSVHALVTGALGTGPITIGTANLAFSNASAGQLAISLANSDSNLYFLTAASAHNATIDSNGTVTFANDADAAHARIANSHMVIFDDSATASNAVITNRANGLTGFFGNNTADQATVVNNAGGRVDISGLSTSGIGIGSLSGNGAVYLGAKTLVLGGLGMNETIGGVIRNGGEFGGAGGGLVKTGAGNLVLAGLNTYTGATTVNAGTLSVNGSIASSSLTTVNPGGTLGGNGTVGDTTIDGGTLAPGNSIGALTVAGNLVMTAASTYMVEVSPAGSDYTHVTGTATLGGATVQASFATGSYVEKRYTILTADGGVSGTFSGPVNTNLPANFKSALAADGNNAYLDLKLNFVTPSGLNVNQHNVATTLVNVFNTNGGIPLAFGALDPRGLSLASGEIATTASQAAFDAQSQFLNTLTDPLAGGYRGSAGAAGSSSQALGYAATAGERKPHDAFASLATKAPPMQTFAQRWRIFGAAYGGNTQIGGNAALGSHDATSRVYGAMGGASYALSP
ncbi:MAG: autotransporter-associated beta strand repeat-containing protein, partial [Rhizobiales bacterium]|nr:autotransporter-associated beta strand repeat-containing protein [Hyphomicrobiales bacterium]